MWASVRLRAFGEVQPIVMDELPRRLLFMNLGVFFWCLQAAVPSVSHGASRRTSHLFRWLCVRASPAGAGLHVAMPMETRLQDTRFTPKWSCWDARGAFTALPINSVRARAPTRRGAQCSRLCTSALFLPSVTAFLNHFYLV